MLKTTTSTPYPSLQQRRRYFRAEKVTSVATAVICNRQYSNSPTVLGQVGLGHECEAYAGNFSPRRQTNMRKLRVSLPNLRKIVNIVKFRRAYTLERDHYFKQQRKICSLLLRKTAILSIIILMRRVLGERVYNLI